MIPLPPDTVQVPVVASGAVPDEGEKLMEQLMAGVGVAVGATQLGVIYKIDV